MTSTPYSDRLRYLDASDLDDSAVDFSTLDVLGSDGRELGDLDGFIVDSLSGRVIYAVVDSGGWFRSRHFVVPIGHARLDPDHRHLNVNVGRDAVNKFPDFHHKDLRRFSDAEMRAFEQRTAIACCPDDPGDVTGAVQYDTIRHYAQPDWWRGDYNRAERYRDLDRWDERSGRSAEIADVRAQAPVRHDESREQQVGTSGRRAAGDVSPHLDGRAQPGDVLGIETGGESTHIGDTAADEDKRRGGR